MPNDLRQPVPEPFDADMQSAVDCFLIAANALEKGLGRLSKWQRKMLTPDSTTTPPQQLFGVGVMAHTTILKGMADRGFIQVEAPRQKPPELEKN